MLALFWNTWLWVAVKTGTTDSKKTTDDRYTPGVFVTVWVGNNDNSPMNPALASGVTGAAPIWNRVMTMLLTNYSTTESWLDCQTPLLASLVLVER